MRCRILKPFEYSTDGITSRRLDPGAEEDLLEVYVPGLAREGYVVPVGDGAAPAHPSLPLESGERAVRARRGAGQRP